MEWGGGVEKVRIDKQEKGKGNKTQIRKKRWKEGKKAMQDRKGKGGYWWERVR